MKLARAERARLRELMGNHFNLNELQNLAFDLGVPDEAVAGPSKGEYIRGLITYCERYQCLPALLELCRREHGDVDWPALPALEPGTESRPKPAKPGATAGYTGVVIGDNADISGTVIGGNQINISDPGGHTSADQEDRDKP